MTQEKSMIRWAQYLHIQCIHACQLAKTVCKYICLTLHVSVGKASQKLHKYRYLYTAPAKP